MFFIDDIFIEHSDVYKRQTSSMAGLCVDGNYVNLQLQDNDVQSIYVDLRHGDVEGTLKGAEDEYSTNAVVTHGDANISSQYREAVSYTHLVLTPVVIVYSKITVVSLFFNASGIVIPKASAVV